jgi:sporulation protein YlmC with PRC-barrel domain
MLSGLKTPLRTSEGYTANQIYSNVFLAEQMVTVPKESRKSLPVQEFIGLQVIDTKGSLVGTVKDISVDFANKGISIRVATKNSGEIDFGWDDVQSVEDGVLLKKEVDIPSLLEETEPRSASTRTVQAHIICPNRGASEVARAKFCSKCGSALRS